MATLVYKYAVRRPARGQVWVPPDHLQEQFDLARHMYNDLVTASREHDETITQVWRSRPEVAAAQDHLDAVVELLEQVKTQARKEHSQDRSTATRESTAARLKQVRADLAGAKQVLKQTRASWYPTLKPAMQDARDGFKDRCKKVRQTYAERGLYWATYNMITGEHSVAVQLVERSRKIGRWAKLSYRRRGGNESVAVQLQRTHGDDCLCPEHAHAHAVALQRAHVKDCEACQQNISDHARAVKADPRLRGSGSPRCAQYAPGVARQLHADHLDALRRRHVMSCGVCTPLLDGAGRPDGGPTACTTITKITQCRCKIHAAEATDQLRLTHVLRCTTCTAAGDRRCTMYRTILVEPDPTLVPKDPPRTGELLACGDGKWKQVLQITPWQDPDQFNALPRSERFRIARTGVARLSCGSKHPMVELPIVVHRMLPADADVAEAKLNLTRVGGKVRAALCVTVKIPDPQPVTGRPPVAVHGGWRLLPDGAIRVGVFTTNQATMPPVPAGLADVVRVYPGATPRAKALRGTRPTGTWGEIVYPRDWLERADIPSTFQGRRGDALNLIKEKVAAWLDQNPQEIPDRDGNPQPLTGPLLRQWRSPARFAVLAMRWRETPPTPTVEDPTDPTQTAAANAGAADIAGILEDWRRQDHHLWQCEAHGRDKHNARRTDTWRKVAAWLADTCGLVILDQQDLTQIRERGEPDDTDPTMPELAARKARARMALTAPGLLRSTLSNAAARRGVVTTTVSAVDLTRTCPHCTEKGITGDPRYARSHVVTCPHCGLTYDQDLSAADQMLTRATQGPG